MSWQRTAVTITIVFLVIVVVVLSSSLWIIASSVSKPVLVIVTQVTDKTKTLVRQPPVVFPTETNTPTFLEQTSVSRHLERIATSVAIVPTLITPIVTSTAINPTVTIVPSLTSTIAPTRIPVVVPVVPTAVPTQVPVVPTIAPTIEPTQVAIVPTEVVAAAPVPYPISCVGLFEGSNAFQIAKENCPGVVFTVLWTSPRDPAGCVFDSNNVPSDFGSNKVLKNQKLVFWIPRLDEDLSRFPDCHSRIESHPGEISQGCVGFFGGSNAFEKATQACGGREFRVKWTNPRDPLGCMFTSSRVPLDFNSPEVMRGQDLAFWIPLDSEDLSSVPNCPNLP